MKAWAAVSWVAGPRARQLYSASGLPRPDVSRRKGQRGPGAYGEGDRFGWCVCKQTLDRQSSSSKCLAWL